MKNMLIYVSFSLFMIFAMCTKNGLEADTSRAELLSLSIEADGKTYKVYPDPSQTLRFKEIYVADNISKVAYRISAGATIVPKPDTITKWVKKQTLTVTSADGQNSKTYQVILEDLIEVTNALFPIRGVNMRAPRHSDVDDFCKFITEDMAPMGGNYLFLRVEFNGYQYKNDGGLEVAPNAITEADVKKIVAACREANIELVPSINLFGHQSWDNVPGPLLRAYPQFKEAPPNAPHFQVGNPLNTGFYRLWSYCPLHPEVHDIVFKYVDELIDVCEAKEFHAGMDEVINIASENCLNGCAGQDPAKLFADEVNLIYEHLQTKGCGMWIWGDRLLDAEKEGLPRPSASGVGTAPAISMLNKNIKICDWRYYPKVGEPNNLGKEAITTKNFVAEDLGVVICPFRSYRNGLAQMDGILKYRAKEPDEDKKKLFLGFCATTWGGDAQAAEFVHLFRKGKAGTITEEEREKGVLRADGHYVGVAGYVYYEMLRKAKELAID